MIDDQSGNLVARWRRGDEQAAAELFQRYAQRLIALVRSRLSAQLSSRFDPEDVIQSVCRSFFAGARAGEYDVERGGDLWRLLVAITLHKLNDQVKRHTSDRRSVRRERQLGPEEGLFSFESHLQTREPSPVEAVALIDKVEHVMRGLPPLHRRMLELRLHGYNFFEIAAETQTGERTVYRVLKRVRQQLEERYGNPASP